MPKITIITPKGEIENTVDSKKRLVLAIEESGVDIGHLCGGYAGCTTCRVQFVEGEPQTMTVAEKKKLKEKEILGTYRLSCQILCSHDMKVKPAFFVNEQDWEGPGGTPKDFITPDPEWIPLDT